MNPVKKEKVILSYEMITYTDLYKYFCFKENQSDSDELLRRELFLKVLADKPHTCQVDKNKHIHGHHFLKIDLSNLNIKNLGLVNCDVTGFNLNKTKIEESIFVHGSFKFSGEYDLKKTIIWGDLSLGEDARVLEELYIKNSFINNSKIKVFRNCIFENVKFYNSDVKRFENCDMFKVMLSDRSLYKRTFNCINVPQVYTINDNIEIIAFGDFNYYVEIKNKISSFINLNNIEKSLLTNSVFEQAGERISKLYDSKKSFFDAINFDRVKSQYDDSFLLSSKGE